MAETNEAVLRRIALKLKDRGMTENAASAAAGNRDLIRDMKRNGSIPKAHRLAALARVLGTTTDWLMYGGPEGAAEHRAALALIPVGSEVAGADNFAADFTNDKHRLAPLPLLGTALAGDVEMPESQLELVELDYGQVIDYLQRPPSLASDRDAYALTILSDSMFPRLSPGERVAVSPRAPVSIGDDVIVHLRGPRAANDEDDRVKTVLVKRLLRRTATHVELRQFNPDLTFRVANERVAAMHKVSGILF